MQRIFKFTYALSNSFSDSFSLFYEHKEDFRRTACTSLLQYVVETSIWRRDEPEGDKQKSKNSLAEGLKIISHT